MPVLSRIRPSPVELVVADDDLPLPRARQTPGLSRVRHGVYAPTTEWVALEPWERYTARVHAYLLRHSDAILCLESAAALAGLPIFGEPRDIHVFAEGASSSHRIGDVVLHTSRTLRDRVTVDGVALTTPAETALDLAAVLPPAFGLAVADAVIGGRRDAITLGDLSGLATQRPRGRGARRREWVLDHADARAESSGESVSRAVVGWLGYPDPVLQQRFPFEGGVDRTDFFWPDQAVVGESDGYGKYRVRDPEESMKRLIAEKRREDRLRRVVRGFARWDWRDALRVVPLDSALRAAGLHPVRTANRGMLATLRVNARSHR